VDVLSQFCSVAPNAIGELLRLAIFEESHQVRIGAMQFVKPEYPSADPGMVTQLLIDPSFAV
jgi:hypothetical protein